MLLFSLSLVSKPNEVQEIMARVKSQWMLKITAYADKLIDGLDGLDYIERVATQQKTRISAGRVLATQPSTAASCRLTSTEKSAAASSMATSSSILSRLSDAR